jgi:hypothetical protein
MGANAILAMRFDNNEIGGVMSEVAAYGTAGHRRTTVSKRQCGRRRSIKTRPYRLLHEVPRTEGHIAWPSTQAYRGAANRP